MFVLLSGDDKEAEERDGYVDEEAVSRSAMHACRERDMEPNRIR